MAGKKPAKPMAGQGAPQKVLDPAIFGTQVRFAGMKGVTADCPCGTRIARGMVRQKGERFYCSTRCAAAS